MSHHEGRDGCRATFTTSVEVTGEPTMLSPDLMYKVACFYLLNKMDEPALKESYGALQDICDFHVVLDKDRYLLLEAKASAEPPRKKVTSVKRSQVAPLQFND